MNPYESAKLLHEYLLFHYGTPEEVLPWAQGPRDALEFARRTVTETIDWEATGRLQRALDVGCAVGRSSFELSRHCEEVIGIDFSESFVAAALKIQSEGQHPYERLEEGRETTPLVARPPQGCNPQVVDFEQGDAMNLREDLAQFDLVHAANLLCRLPEPQRFLRRLPDLVKKGGMLVLTTPCTWLEEFTPPGNWPSGGTLEYLQQHLQESFERIRTLDMPFLIREHRRKYQWSVAQASVWVRR